jgi:hypothetical protein
LVVCFHDGTYVSLVRFPAAAGVLFLTVSRLS